MKLFDICIDKDIYDFVNMLHDWPTFEVEHLNSIFW